MFLCNVKYVTIHQFLILLVWGTTVFTGSGSEIGLVIYSFIGSPDKHMNCLIHQSAGICWTSLHSLNYHSGVCFIRKFFLVEQGKSITLCRVYSL
jgi:hypothetical protein